MTWRAVICIATGFLPFILGALLLHDAVINPLKWSSMIGSYSFFLVCAYVIYLGFAKEDK